MRTHSMKKHTKIALGVTGALAVVGGLAFAGTQVVAGDWGHGFKRAAVHHGMQMFDRFDQDGDGKITQAEITAYRDKTFTANDKDGDGSIDLGEFEGVWLDQMRPFMVDRFQMMDDNGDGEITQTEIDGKVRGMMRWMDKNDDGALELRELKRGKRWGYHDDDDDDDDDYKYKNRG